MQVRKQTNSNCFKNTPDNADGVAYLECKRCKITTISRRQLRTWWALCAIIAMWLSIDRYAAAQYDETTARVFREAFAVDYIEGRHGMGLHRTQPTGVWTLLVTDNTQLPEAKLIAQGEFEEIARFRYEPFVDITAEMQDELFAMGIARHEMFYAVGTLRGQSGYERLVLVSINEFEALNAPTRPFVISVFFPMRDDIDVGDALQLAQDLANPESIFSRRKEISCQGFQHCCDQRRACRQAAYDAFQDRMRILLGVTYTGLGGCLMTMVGCALFGPMGVVVCGLACAAAFVSIELAVWEREMAIYDGALLDCQSQYFRCMRAGPNPASPVAPSRLKELTRSAYQSERRFELRCAPGFESNR